MNAKADDAIDIVEAAYDLTTSDSEWLANLVRVAAPTFDRGMGCVGSLSAGMKNDSNIVLAGALEGTAPDIPMRFARAAQAAPEGEIGTTTKVLAGTVMTLHDARDQMPASHAALTEHVGCADILGIWALDPNLAGVQISAPSGDVIGLSEQERKRFEMLMVHITAGSRLRLATVPENPAPRELGEVLLDPKTWRIADAAADSQQPVILDQVRTEAVQVDRARGKLRKSDPDEALELWNGLVRGRWSLVDRFDTDGRRFVLAKPNAPNLGDPRALTRSEHQAVTYAARGESGKLIGYRFGLSPQRVSMLLKSAMKKLGARTQAQLAERMRALPGRGQATDPDAEFS